MASTKIVISEKIFEEYLKKFSTEKSLTGFVNQTVEKYIDEKILELNPQNYLMIKALSIKMNKPMEEVLNICLASVKFEARTVEIPVDVPEPPKMKSNKKVKKENPFINY